MEGTNNSLSMEICSLQNDVDQLTIKLERVTTEQDQLITQPDSTAENTSIGDL